MILNINEIFRSLQGEAHWAGTPALFIRLQGCDVGCPWCDTRDSWPIKARMVLDESGVQDLLDKSPERHVVITGGEPLQHRIDWLVRAVIESGRRVQIETSGTYELPDWLMQPNSHTWITVSPKIGFNRPLIDSVVMEADEIKMPVRTMADVDNLLALLDRISWNRGDVWLQPLSQSRRATAICIDQAAKHGFRVSVQVHKYLGLQ